ncbi:MAG: Type II restriction enzyme DpnII [Lachnoclostridium sp.]
MDGNTSYNFNFTHPNYSIDDYVNFMRKSGLFELLSNHIVSNLNDYVLGIETGLDSNGRKNRGGHLMEKLVESYIKKLTIKYTYYKEMYLSEIQNKWGINLANLSNDGKAEKRFDFVIKTDSMVYAIETNFYGSGGSKLNETARSYKMLSLEAKQIEGFKFIWITDGTSWFTAKKNLQETFDIMDDMYNITDLENGILNQIIV